MTPEVAGVEEPASIDLDQQHVRMEGRVVGQEGRDTKGPELEGLVAAPGVQRA
jgi:hypothetical protein